MVYSDFFLENLNFNAFYPPYLIWFFYQMAQKVIPPYDVL
jgi:hypothetical protein